VGEGGAGSGYGRVSGVRVCSRRAHPVIVNGDEKRGFDDDDDDT